MQQPFSHKDEMIRDHYLSIICSNIGISPDIVLDYRGRKRAYLEPRQVLQYALCENTKMSYQMVADLTYKKKHCTIMHNRGVVQNLLDTDKKFRDKYAEPLRMIKKRTENRCLVIGDIYNIENQERLKEIEKAMVQNGRYPVLIYRKEGEEYEKVLRNRLKILLECGSVYVLPDYEQSHDAVLEYKVAQRLGIEIIYHQN